MTIRFMDRTGEQVELTINEFAEALCQGQIWGLAYRYYNDDHPLNGNVTAPHPRDYCNPVYRPKWTKLAKHLRSLPEVNNVFEFRISFAEHIYSDDYVDMTFARQGDNVLVEIH